MANYKIKIKNKEISVEEDDLSPFDITTIENNIEDEFKRMEEKGIVNSITQFYTLVAKYAVENYILRKSKKIDVEKINESIDKLVIELREVLNDEKLF